MQHYDAFCSITCLTRMSRHTWQQNVTTIIQPLHRELQAQIPKRPLTTHTAHMNNQPHVAEQQGRTNSRPERLSRNRRTHTHTQGIFHRHLQPLCTEKHKASCSSFLPKTNPMQQSCGHYNAFCSMTWLTRMSRHRWQQCSGFLPNPSPRQHSCSHYNASCCGTCRFIQHVTTSLSLRFPQSPSFIASLRSSTCTFIQHVTTSLCHHCP